MARKLAIESTDDVRRARRDAGFSLAEVAVVVALLAIVVVPVLLAVTSSIRVSRNARSAAQIETALVNAADRVNRADSGRCGDTAANPLTNAYRPYAQAAVQSQGWNADRAVVEEAWFDSTTGTWVPGACPIDPVTGFARQPNNLIQRITITITSPDDQVRRSTEVVKSDV